MTTGGAAMNLFRAESAPTDSPFEEVLLDCAACPYAYEAHVDGQCPDEATAVAVWGRS